MSSLYMTAGLEIIGDETMCWSLSQMPAAMCDGGESRLLSCARSPAREKTDDYFLHHRDLAADCSNPGKLHTIPWSKLARSRFNT